MHRPYGLYPVLNRLLTAVFVITTSACLIQTASAEEAYDSTLNCKMTKYKNSEYTDQITRSWVPENQQHKIIRSKGAAYASTDYDSGFLRGSVTVDTDKRIAFQYQNTAIDDKDRPLQTKWILTYFPTTKKIAIKVLFTGYRNIETVWGTCEEHKSSSISSSSNEQQTSNEQQSSNALFDNKIDMTEWKLIRSGYDTRIYYRHKDTSLMIATQYKYLDEAFEQISQGKQSAWLFGTNWRDESYRPVKYDFKLWKPEKISAGMADNLQAIIITDKRVLEVLKERKKFNYVWIEADDAWEWHRTKKN